jgi:hypothetical protein
MVNFTGRGPTRLILKNAMKMAVFFTRMVNAKNVVANFVRTT